MNDYSKIEPPYQYCVLDTAQGDLDISAIQKEVHVSLYRGEPERLLDDVAPYLVRCRPGSSFNKWLFDNGWGNCWGIFLQSEASMGEVRKHFRHFLLVKTEEGEELYFRFYDPRVLRVFLPICTNDQLTDFFGPVQKYIVEDENPRFALLFSLNGGILQTEKIDLQEEALPVNPAPRPETKPQQLAQEENTIV